MAPPAVRSSWRARTVAFFRRHPILLLLALTPGIPEYLSGSSSVALLAINPVVFLLFLGLNLGLYGPGVLLVREAAVRWHKGWSTVLLLGAAYGLLEEGTALSTLFDPQASVVGGLGSYGHAYGVNWVWLIGVLGVHVVYSVGLPILLLGLALPETRGRPFLTGRRLPLAVGVYALDVVVLAFIVHYFVALDLLVLAAVAAGGLWVLAYRMPAGRLDPPGERPTRGPAFFFVLGVAYFVLLLVVPGTLGDEHLPAFAAGAADLVVIGGLFLAGWRSVGRTGNALPLLAFAAGAILPLAFVGFVAQWYLPIVLIPDAVAVLFFRTLWQHYRAPPDAAAAPPRASPV